MRNIFKTAYVKTVAGAMGAFALMSSAAHAETTPIEDLFAGVDLEGVADLVVAMGLTIISIAVVFVGIKLVKRGLSRV